MKAIPWLLKGLATAALLISCAWWMLNAFFIFVLTVSNRMDDNGCHAGHPAWALLQLGVALLGTVAATASVGLLTTDETATRSSWAFATGVLMFVVWLGLLKASPHAHVISAGC